MQGKVEVCFRGQLAVGELLLGRPAISYSTVIPASSSPPSINIVVFCDTFHTNVGAKTTSIKNIVTYTLSSYYFLRRMTTFLGPRRRCSLRMTQRGTLSSEAFVSLECSTATGRILKRLSRETGACSLRTFFHMGSFQSFSTNAVLRKSFLG